MNPQILRGLASAVGVMFIWSGFFVFSRAGVSTNLTPFDITGLRFIVAGCLVLPFIKKWWPYHLKLRPLLLMAACGPGAIYSTFMYLGLQQASVAYAGVFANGFLPVITTAIAFLVTRDLPKTQQILAIVVIFAGGLIIGVPGMTGGSHVLSGIAFFLISSTILAVYIDGVKRHNLTPTQALAIITLPNALIYLPLWYFVLPTGLAETDLPTIAFQALFQGLGPGFLAVLLFAIAAVNLGPTPTASFSSAVPATATLLAIPVLGEIPSSMEWVGLGVVTFGLILLIFRRN